MPLPKSAELFYDIKLTDEQLIYANSFCDNLTTWVQARSGSGKTTVGVGTAFAMQKKLHYIFATVEEKALGFTTGDAQEKESKYLTPLYDALDAIDQDPSRAILNMKDPKALKQGEWWIKAYSHNYMRGGNIKDAYVIIDEAQNLTKKELRKILTRIHDSCHVAIIGDPNQCDLKNPSESGFIQYLEHYKGHSFANVCSLTKNFRGVISSHAELL